MRRPLSFIACIIIASFSSISSANALDNNIVDNIAPKQDAKALKQHKSTPGINLSLWRKVSTQPNDTVGSTFLNLGFLSTMNRLNGVGLNILGGVVRQDVNGVQVGGIFNIAGNNMRGIQLSGITNVTGNNLTGFSLSGLVGVTGNNVRGVMMSGLANINGDNSSGIAVGGLLNVMGKQSSGVHLAGLADISGDNFNGVALSGFLGIVGKNVEGIQLSGLANIAGGDVTGAQLSGISNITGGTFHGLQLSPVNLAARGKGLQIGLYNYYKDNFNGFQLGLVNANPSTRVQLMLFGGNSTKLNIGARFKNKLFYTILGAGTHYLDFSDKFSASLFYRAGLELPLYKQLFISGDLGFQHIELFKNKDYGFPERLYALQARLNLEYRLTHQMGVFVTGGYGGSRYYNKSTTYDKGLIAEAGIILFSY